MCNDGVTHTVHVSPVPSTCHPVHVSPVPSTCHPYRPRVTQTVHVSPPSTCQGGMGAHVSGLVAPVTMAIFAHVGNLDEAIKGSSSALVTNCKVSFGDLPLLIRRFLPSNSAIKGSSSALVTNCKVCILGDLPH